MRLHFGCTWMAVDKRHPAAARLFWRIDAALKPAAPVQAAADAIVRKMRAQSRLHGTQGRFNALHLRVEPDWVQHCARWESNASASPRDNCMTNTDRLDRVFAIEGVDSRELVYVAMQEKGPLRDAHSGDNTSIVFVLA